MKLEFSGQIFRKKKPKISILILSTTFAWNGFDRNKDLARNYQKCIWVFM